MRASAINTPAPGGTLVHVRYSVDPQPGTFTAASGLSQLSTLEGIGHRRWPEVSFLQFTLFHPISNCMRSYLRVLGVRHEKLERTRKKDAQDAKDAILGQDKRAEQRPGVCIDDLTT